MNVPFFHKQYTEYVKIFAKSAAYVVEQIFTEIDSIKRCPTFRNDEVEMVIMSDVANYH